MKAGMYKVFFFFFLLLGEADWQLVGAFDRGFLAASCKKMPDMMMVFDV